MLASCVTHEQAVVPHETCSVTDCQLHGRSVIADCVQLICRALLCRYHLQVAGQGAVVGVSANVILLSHTQGTEHLLGVASVVEAHDRLWIDQT